MHYAAVQSRAPQRARLRQMARPHRRKAAGSGREKLIFLSIGEPDSPPPKAILDVAERQMRAGRTRYSSGRGEPEILGALPRMYSKRTGRR